MNLQEILDEKQMTMYRLSKEARVSFTTISEICSGKRKDIKLDGDYVLLNYSLTLGLNSSMSISLQKLPKNI